MTLLMLHTAPLRDGSPAPATRLMGRTLRTLVPKLETTDSWLTDIESSSKRYDSKNVCTGQVLKPLRGADKVRITEAFRNNWLRKAKFIEQQMSPRSYIVKTEDGNKLRRREISFIYYWQESHL